MLMLLQNKQGKVLLKITDVEALIDPMQAEVTGQIQEGEEEQEKEQFSKADLTFPSGEALPKCWLNADYRLEQS